MLNKMNINSLVLLLVMIVFSSCQAPEAYRRAATAFSQGSESEMRGRFIDLAGETPTGMVAISDIYPAPPADPERTADQYYQEAMKELGTALKGESQLSKINVLDNALAIKALTQWRSGEYDAAKATAEQALPLLEQDNGGEDDARDRTMMQALPGLINVDKAYAALQQTLDLGKQLTSAGGDDEKQTLFTQIKQNYLDFASSEADGASSVARALSMLQTAYDEVPEEGSLRLYLLNAQLAGLDSWGDLRTETFKAARRSNAGEEEMAWLEQERRGYEDMVTDYLSRLAGSSEEGEDSKLYRFWKRVL